MRHQLLDLYEIQKLDICIRDIERRRDAIPGRLNELEATIAETRKLHRQQERRLAVDEFGWDVHDDD